MITFEQHESEVRGYCRTFPAIFSSAKGAWMTDIEGRRYLDFFAGPVCSTMATTRTGSSRPYWPT